MRISFASFRSHFAVYLLYLALAILITWPLLTVFSTHFPGFSDGDAHEMTRHIWWFKYALQHGQPLIFQPLLAYPDGLQGVILWSDPLQFFPGWLFAFFLPLPAAYNLQVLLTLALNGWAAYWLVFRLTRPSNNERSSSFLDRLQPHLPALLAGVVFMAAPTIQGHFSGGHGGLLVQWPLPLLAYALLRVTGLQTKTTASQHRRGFWIVVSAVLVLLTASGHTLQLIYAVMPLSAVLAVTIFWRREWQSLLKLALAVGLGCVLLLVFLLPVFSATFGTSAYTDEGGAVRYSVDLLAIGTPSFFHGLFGQWEYTHRVLGVNMVEGSSYIGVVVALLAIVAVWKIRAARWWLGLGLVAWVLSLGPLLKVFDTPVKLMVGGYETYITLPWVLVYDLPGFNLARTPGRFNFLLALTVAVLAGYGVAWLFGVARTLPAGQNGISNDLKRRSQVAALAAVVLAAFILFEYQAMWPEATYSAEIPQAVYDLAKREDVRAIFDIPWDNVLAAKEALWFQTAHEKPLIAGQVTRRTPVNPAKLAVLQETTNAERMKADGADVLIVHKRYLTDPNWSAAVALYLGSPIYEDEQIAIFYVPDKPLQQAASSVTFSKDQRIEQYFYSAEPGWVRLDNLGAGLVSEGREIRLSVDGEPLYQWKPNPSDNFGLWLPLPDAGYHTVQLTLQPECPLVYDPALRCPLLGYAQNEKGYIAFSDPLPGTFEPVKFDRGVTLNGNYLSWINHFSLGLWWQFDQPVTGNDVRFVKLLDEQGVQVSGVDLTLNNHAAGEQWVDTVDFPMSGDLPSGTYKVCVGWYSYPDVIRFPVLSQVDGAQDSLACLGSFTVPKAGE